MIIDSDKLEHIQEVINCLYSVAQMCTRNDMVAHYLGTPYLDDFMSQNELTTKECSFNLGESHSWLTFIAPWQQRAKKYQISSDNNQVTDWRFKIIYFKFFAKLFIFYLVLAVTVNIVLEKIKKN